MLMYKRIETGVLTAGKETIFEILSCPEGKRYKIVSIHCKPDDDLYLRVYRGAKQIVDITSMAMTEQAPLLPMDLPLTVGQVVKAGYYNDGSGATTGTPITIGYRDD